MKSHDVAKLLLELPNLKMVCTAAYSGAMIEVKGAEMIKSKMHHCGVEYVTNRLERISQQLKLNRNVDCIIDEIESYERESFDMITLVLDE